MFHNYYHMKDLMNRELFEVYFLLFFRKLALSMVGIFLPLYLLIELGFPFSKVIFFFITMFVVMGITLFPTMNIVSKYGSKHSILFSIPLLVAGMILIIILQQRPNLYWVAAALLGADLALFWIGFHIDTAINSKRKALGKESAVLWLVKVFATVIGPLLGGLILLYLNFTILFIIAIALLVISVIPLFTSKEVFAKTDYDIKYLISNGHWRYFLAYFAQGIRSTATAIFWPIFIFTILGSYLSLGIYGTFATIFVAVAGYFIGQISDQTSRRTIIKLSAITEGIIWIVRVFVTTVIEVFTLGTLGSITTIGVDIPLLAKSYNRAKKERVAGFVLFRELSIRCGQIALLLIVLAVGTTQSAFVVAGVATLLYFLF